MISQLPARFSDRIKVDAAGCWLWSGALQADGYARVWFQGKRSVLHRHVFQIVRGTIPGGFVLDHLCRVRHCCNPDHLRVVTQGENVHAVGSLCRQKINAEKTHCKRGHEFTPENTRAVLRHGRPGRYCRKCIRQAKRAARAK